MGGLLSSPSKQAASAAQAQQGLSNQEIGQLEQYVSGAEQQQRGAIAGMGPNPYFTAAGEMSPSSYAVDPSKTTDFATSSAGAPVITPGAASPFLPSAAAALMQNPFTAPAGAPAAMAPPTAGAPAVVAPPAAGSPGAILPPGMVPPGFVPGQGNGSPLAGTGQ